MRTSEDINEILPALAKVKAAMGSVAKDSSNPFFKSKYADLNSHLKVVEPLLGANGLLLVQPVDNTGDGNIVESTIYHTESGQFITSSMKLVGEADMQKVGSAVTYARRYTLGSLLSMMAEDDDANFASGKGKSKSTYNKQAAKSTAKSAATTERKSFSRRPKSTPAPAVEETYGDDL